MWYTHRVMFPRHLRYFAIALFVPVALTAAAFVPHAIHAQTVDVSTRRAQLQSQLDDLNKQIAQTQSVLDDLHGEHQSIARDISILDAGIKRSQLQVRATQVQIEALASNISIHSNTIGVLTDKLSVEQRSLGQIIRHTRELDDYSLVEVVMSAEDISDFFGDLDTYTTLKEQIAVSSAQLSSTRAATETEKDQLVTQKTQKDQLKTLQVAEQQKIKDQQAQKKVLLAKTQKQEATYQSIFDTQQKTAAQIRAELFGLAGGGGKIPLPTAIEYAKTASRLTGVRPAFILAILSQESDLGVNVGQCYVTNLTTGDGKGKNTGTPFSGVMKAPRDTAPFQRLMDALGRDWSSTPVSCPQAGGYGGAMGPTQFIPSTWVGIEAQLKSKLGIAATDPWNPLHAIVATGIYLAAVGGTSSGAEHTAAAKYYAGGSWATSGQVYANSVMAKAAVFQDDIDTLGG